MKQENQDQIEENNSSRLDIIRKILSPVVVIFNKILPPYEPRIDLDEKLVKGENTTEHAIIRHFSEIQLVLGILTVFIGPILQGIFNSGFFIFFSIMGIVLVLSAYEMEEIYVTSHRVMLRRVGMIERILRVPSDEEHSIEHIVSLQVGRAPVNIILVVLAGLGFFFTLVANLTDVVLLFALIPSTVILIYGLRINRRAVTLQLAGGLAIIMGIRKGIPKRIVSAIQISIYGDKPILIQEPVETLSKKVETAIQPDEKPAKDLDH